jgi:hypothetical protein
MKKINFTLSLLLVGTTLLTGCSMLTAQGRRERAYAHYVTKYSYRRAKLQRRLSVSRAKIPKSEPSEPIVNTEVSGPESVNSGGSGM